MTYRTLTIFEEVLYWKENPNAGKTELSPAQFNQVGQEILGREDVPIDKIVTSFEEYLDLEYDDSLWPYPNIIVDEAQDLSDTLLEHLSYLMEISGGVFYTFYDRNQAIMRKEPSSGSTNTPIAAWCFIETAATPRKSRS